MSKQKGEEREEDKRQKDKSIPDSGQGSAGNFGSDGDLGKGDNEKLKERSQSSPGTVKRKPKTESKP